MATRQAAGRARGPSPRPNGSARRGWFLGAAAVMLVTGLVVGAVVVGGDEPAGGGPVATSAPATLLTPDQAQEIVSARAGDEDFAVLDVRTPQEYQAGHLEGATLVDLSAPDFAARVGELDRSRTYLVYCRSGNRSAAAVQEMRRLGFPDLYDLQDGIGGWQAAGGEVVRS